MVAYNGYTGAAKIKTLQTNHNAVIKYIKALKIRLILIIWAGNFLISCNLSPPKYNAIIAEIAERVWAKIQIIAEIKEPAIPTAASASVGFMFKFPTIAVSVIDNKGSAIPEIIAGIANLLIDLNEMVLVFCNFFKKMFTSAKIKH